MYQLRVAVDKCPAGFSCTAADNLEVCTDITTRLFVRLVNVCFKVKRLRSPHSHVYICVCLQVQLEAEYTDGYLCKMEVRNCLRILSCTHAEVNPIAISPFSALLWACYYSWQFFCIPHLRMFKCYNSTALN
jgi:hypothetical protein